MIPNLSEEHEFCRMEVRLILFEEIVSGIFLNNQLCSFPVKHYLFEKEK